MFAGAGDLGLPQLDHPPRFFGAAHPEPLRLATRLSSVLDSLALCVYCSQQFFSASIEWQLEIGSADTHIRFTLTPWSKHHP